MVTTILDCYTDEPAGLGVPPYLGTYPRYIYGYLKDKGEEDIYYLTIDDLRLFKVYNNELKRKQKTDIKVYNLTLNHGNIAEILSKTTELIIILGVHTPGKYLSALPGTLKEVIRLVDDLKCRKTLTGPAVYGNASEGGKFFEKVDLSKFDEIKNFEFSYKDITIYSVIGNGVISQIPSLRIAEIETSRGCSRKKGCSFCTEPIKHRFEFREMNSILKEIEGLYKLGVRDVRGGKQSCFYSYPDSIKLLENMILRA